MASSFLASPLDLSTTGPLARMLIILTPSSLSQPNDGLGDSAEVWLGEPYHTQTDGPGVCPQPSNGHSAFASLACPLLSFKNSGLCLR